MACMEVPHIDCIMTPRCAALGLKGFSKISEPNLFADRFRNGLAFVFGIYAARPRHRLYTHEFIRPKGGAVIRC